MLIHRPGALALTAAALSPVLTSSALTAQARFAAPVQLRAGDALLGEGRMYPSPMLHDIDGDGRLDAIVGDLRGHITFALRRADGTFAAEQQLKDAKGKLVEFGNWSCVGMSPQFVDFDGDGHTDIVAGIFDGSPHVARGDGEHFMRPQQILDRAGARIVMNKFWDFERKDWGATDRCDPEGATLEDGHLTSAWAFDWDRDGDLDLLLGDHEHGHVMLRRNEGTKGAPQFATRNELVTVGGQPLVVAGTVTTLRMVDWNGDGREDLLVGSMGDPYGDDAGGGVFVHLDVGDGAATQPGPAITLIPVSSKPKVPAPQRPDCGLHMDAADLDGDGDLDLIVGGYSMWTPAERALSESQKTERDKLEKRVATLNEHKHAFFEKLQHNAGDMETEAGQKRFQELYEERKDELDRVEKQLKDVEQQLAKLQPQQQRRSFVWLYENLAAGATTDK